MKVEKIMWKDIECLSKYYIIILSLKTVLNFKMIEYLIAQFQIGQMESFIKIKLISVFNSIVGWKL